MARLGHQVNKRRAGEGEHLRHGLGPGTRIGEATYRTETRSLGHCCIVDPARGGDGLVAGDLVFSIVAHHQNEILSRHPHGRRESPEAHQHTAIPVQTDDASIRLCERNPEGEIGRMPHCAVRGREVEFAARQQPPGSNHAHRRDDDFVGDWMLTLSVRPADVVGLLQIEQTDDLKACERLQDRIVRLSSGVAVIHVGGSTEVEMTERKHRIEDALEAVRSAQEQGVVPGGGTALLRACRSLSVPSDGLDTNEDQTLGATIIQRACEAPLRQMATNAGLSADIATSNVMSAGDNMGVDFRTGELINMLDAGIIDPVKVTLTALKNAASCAGTLITTNYGIIQTD